MFGVRHAGRAGRVSAGFAIIAAFALPCPHAWAGKDSPGTEIRDLYYGEVLFHFYQQDEYTALNHLRVARQAGRVNNHADEAELLLGGLYLSYGQHRRAGEIFDRLLAKNTDRAVRSRVWFYLGKVRYQRGWVAAAEEAFGHVEGGLPEALDAEYHMLLAQTLMAQERFSEAADVLDSWDGREDWMAFARYNLGVAFVRTNRVGDGARLLNRVGQLKTDAEEMLALRDRANLALGYVYLQAERGELAKDILERVRLHGPFSNKALLGVGWADSLEEDYRGALNPWLELRDRDLLDSAVQESLLAVPFAFSQLDANGSAADYYLAALDQYAVEIVRLDGAIKRAESGAMVAGLLQKDESGVGRWHWQLEALPNSEDARYLYHLVANNEFQDGLRNYRDLLELRRHLAEWQGKLGAFDDMVDTRAKAYSQRLPVVEARLAEIDVEKMRARRDALADDLAAIGRSGDAAGLADEREADLWRQLQAMESSRGWNSAQTADVRNKHRILKGVLQWDLERHYNYRLWQQRRSLAELDRALADAERMEGNVHVAQATIPGRLREFSVRIAALAPRIDSMQRRISTALGEQEKQLHVLAARELEGQKERLSVYRLQARFALAAIYDTGSMVSADGEEPGR